MEAKKTQDERFLGNPNSINTYTTPNGEKYETKIGDDGRAVMERHHTTHNREHTGHSNPHDHEIDWSNGFPHLGEPINYNIYPVPEFKCFERIKFMDIQGNTDELKFESINDFKFALIYGREIEFEWNGVNYGVFHEGEDDEAFFLCEAHKDDKGVFFRTADELLDFVIDGKPLREFITEVTVWNRNI